MMVDRLSIMSLKIRAMGAYKPIAWRPAKSIGKHAGSNWSVYASSVPTLRGARSSTSCMGAGHS